MTPKAAAAFAAALLWLPAQPARAQEQARDFCADRPGRGSPPCVLDIGRLQVEASLVDFTHDRQPGATTDTTLYGDLGLRLGVTSGGEAQLAFSPDVRSRQKDPGGVASAHGYGDATLAWRQSLKNPDGSGISIALQPYVTIPLGRRGFGAGAWQGGLVVPMAFALPDGFSLALSPQLAAARNASHDGAHLDASGVVGLSHPLGRFSLAAEVYADYDDDPSGRTIQETFDLAGAWLPPGMDDTQLDLGVNAGLDHAAPDYEVYAGFAHRF